MAARAITDHVAFIPSIRVFPVIQFFPDRHMAIPYWSVAEWLAATRRFEILEKPAS